MLARYIVKRILIFLPTLFVISLVIFFLDKNIPDDPVLRGVGSEDMINENIYKERWKAFNLDYPNFYFSFTAKHEPDTLYKIPQKYKKTILRKLVNKTGNWTATQAYFQAIEKVDKVLNATKRDSVNANALIDVRKSMVRLYRTSNQDKIRLEINKINTASRLPSLKPLHNAVENLQNKYQDYLNAPTLWKKYIPSFRWHGTDNQYHIWIFGNQPWIERTEGVVDVQDEKLTTKVISHDFTAKSTGYFRVNLSMNLESNKGNISSSALETKKVFEIGINKERVKYTEAELAEAEFLVYAEAGERIPITFNATNYTKINQLDYAYDLGIERLLNYNPAKRSKGFIRFDFGKNYELQPVSEVIKGGLFWTVLLSFCSILLTYSIAIPLGVYSAKRKGSTADNLISTVLFMLYSLPNFWVATLMIVYLCEVLGWFPVFGLGDVAADANFLETFQTRAYHLILPLYCWTYPSLAFLSRQMRGGMLVTLSQDFIRTARAKGVSEKMVIWKHGFRNSLLPIITLFANVFPRMVSGSIVIEVIFGIPGMGKIMLDAINSSDFPTVFTIVMLTALLTMIGYLIADILYALVDPRIRYK